MNFVSFFIEKKYFTTIKRKRENFVAIMQTFLTWAQFTFVIGGCVEHFRIFSSAPDPQPLHVTSISNMRQSNICENDQGTFLGIISPN